MTFAARTRSPLSGVVSRSLRWLIVGGALTSSSVAWAQQKTGRVVTISEVTIVGRIQKPIAAVDVSRIQPRLAMAEVKLALVRKIEAAILHEPF